MVLGIGALFLMLACNNKKAIDPLFMGKIEREEISVVTKVPGKIERLLVQEGDVVSKGDTLAILEIPEVDAKEAQALGALEAANAQYNMAVRGATKGQLTQLQAKVDGLEEQYLFAEKSLGRLSNLLQDSLIPQQQYDEVYAKYQGAKNQYLAALAEIEEVKGGARQEQQIMALGQKSRAEGAVSEVRVAARERYLIAPQDMSIETVNLKTGELALAGYPIFNGYIKASVYFRFTVPENDMAGLENGRDVSIRIGYKDNETVEGRISAVRALSSYANIATAYPDFDNQQALFEVKVAPLDASSTEGLITNASVSLILK